MSNPTCLECKEFRKGGQNVEKYTHTHTHTHTHAHTRVQEQGLISNAFINEKVKVLVAQLCPTLCDPMDCGPQGSSVHGDSPGKNTGVGSHSLCQGIFPIWGWNTSLLHCRQIPYHLNHHKCSLIYYIIYFCN